MQACVLSFIDIFLKKISLELLFNQSILHASPYTMIATITVTLIITVLVTIPILFILISFFLANRALSIPPASRPSLNPETFSFPYKHITIPTEDQLNLSAWWLPVPQSLKPVIIIIHGLAASKEHMISHIMLCQKLGFSVLALDLRGHGDSDPSFTSIGYHEQKDVHSALRYLEKQGEKSFILWGTSMGAVTAIHVAADTTADVRGCILDAPFDTLKNTLAHHAKLMFGLPRFPLLPLTFYILEQKMKFSLDHIDSLKAAEKITSPILFLAGEKDERMPPSLIEKIHEKAPKSHLHIMKDQKHEFRDFDEDLSRTITDFLQEVSSPPSC